MALFQQFDVLETLYPSNQRRYENRVAPPPVEAQAQRVRNAGCITLTRDLAGHGGGRPGRRSPTAAPAIAPISLHAGRRHQHGRTTPGRAPSSRRTGVPARSVGSAPLGRRIYLGPFATQGALDEARDLALRAGFAAPYPARF